MLLTMLQDLVQHKNYANATLLNAISGHGLAAADAELQRLLHHIILANRFWLALFRDHSFDVESESRLPSSLQEISTLFRQTHDQEIDWITGIHESDLDRTLATPFLPDRTVSLAQAVMQVCMHSHGHRAQCATRMRALGGDPPATDFILWLKDRPAAK